MTVALQGLWSGCCGTNVAQLEGLGSLPQKGLLPVLNLISAYDKLQALEDPHWFWNPLKDQHLTVVVLSQPWFPSIPNGNNTFFFPSPSTSSLSKPFSCVHFSVFVNIWLEFVCMCIHLNYLVKKKINLDMWAFRFLKQLLPVDSSSWLSEYNSWGPAAVILSYSCLTVILTVLQKSK